jgi:hypothetical protein
MTKPANRPVHEVAIGHVKVVIWANGSPNGTRYNATVARLYKDGEEWKETAGFGRDDLLVLAKALDQAHTWIFEQKEPPAEANSGSGS